MTKSDCLSVMKRACALLAVAALVAGCLALTACGGSTSAPNKTSPTQQASITVQDVVGTDGLYCLKSDRSITEGGKQTVVDDRYISDEEPLVIDRSKGDQLIYTGDIFYPRSTANGEFGMEWYAEKYYWGRKALRLNKTSELLGMDVEGKFDGVWGATEANKVLEPKGFHFIPSGKKGEECTGAVASVEPSSFTSGGYNGTEWVESEIVTDIPIYEYTKTNFKEDYVFQAPIIKGKEGYFTVDLSDVEAGLYMSKFDDAAHSWYVVEIV